jgi:HemY protein
MRKLYLLALLALVLSVGVVALIEREPGYVLVSYGHYTIESSLWVALALAVVALLLAYALLRLIHALLLSPFTLSQWFSGRREGRSAETTQRGVVKFVEGHYGKARSLLLKGAENTDASLFNYLGAAGASARLGEPEEAARYLAAAEDSEQEVGDAVLLARARLAVEAGEYTAALAILDGGSRQPTPAALELQRQALSGVGDWQGLAQLLPELKKHSSLSGESLLRMEREVYTELLEACVERGPTASENTLQQQWQRVPTELKRDPELVQVYCRSLLAMQDHQTAEAVILKSQRQRWDPQLARLYASVESDDPARQLATAEDWRDKHGDEPELYLCLGRLAARNELWGKAREYFEQSLKLGPSAEVCAELARLLAAQGEHEAAGVYFRDALALASLTLPELPLPAGPV